MRALTVNSRDCFCEDCRKARARFVAGLHAAHRRCPWCGDTSSDRRVREAYEKGGRLLVDGCCAAQPTTVMPIHTECQIEEVQP